MGGVVLQCTVGDPAAAMLKALAAGGIAAAQEGTAHAAIDEVIPGGGIQQDEGGAGLGHDSDR